jgi:sec-independent protein translocase protein TatA
MGEGLFQPTHLIIILVIVLIIFGAGKLPEIGGAMGKSIKEFKHNVNEEVEPPLAPGTAPAGGASTAPTAPPVMHSQRPVDLPGARADDL